MNFLYEDLEFSNFNAEEGSILELAMCAVIDGIEQEPFHEFGKPVNRAFWSEGAEKVHGISWGQAQSFQSQEALAEKALNYINKFETMFTAVGHNIGTDKKYMENLFRKHSKRQDWLVQVRPKWRCTLKRAKARKTKIRTENFKLGTLCSHFSIDIDAHKGLSDMLATIKLDNILDAITPDIKGKAQFMPFEGTWIQKRKRYLDSKYIIFNGDGELFITKEATENKEAMQFIMTEIWDMYCEDNV